jgi:glucosamine-6-phosphate deaminase
MLILIKDDYAAISDEAARIVSNAIRRKPSLRLGLATGSTPLGMYERLVHLHREQGLDLSQVMTFNLDEYVGLPPDHPQSFHHYMHRHFFDHVNIKPEHIFIPDGTERKNWKAYCEEYEARIRRAGGIDLQILGIGENGHIGFNEPTSSLASRTRPKALTEEILNNLHRLFRADEPSPKAAVTMGIGTILDARKILLLATGRSKAEAIARAIEGPISACTTASALQLHPCVTALLDEEAAAALRQRDYYRQAADLTRQFTPERLW